MTDIIEIQEKLRDTTARLAELRAQSVDFSGQAWFMLSIRSVEKRRDKLERILRRAVENANGEAPPDQAPVRDAKPEGV